MFSFRGIRQSAQGREESKPSTRGGGLRQRRAAFATGLLVTSVIAGQAILSPSQAHEPTDSGSLLGGVLGAVGDVLSNDREPASERQNSPAPSSPSERTAQVRPSGPLPTGAAAPKTGAPSLPISAEWLSNTLGRAVQIGKLENKVVPGAIERRDKAASDWRAAVTRFKKASAQAAKIQDPSRRAQALRRAVKLRPDPLAKPMYTVVWSANQSAVDTNTETVTDLLKNLNDVGEKLVPGLDGAHVIDMRPRNIDGSANPDYARVVNFVELPLPWGIGAEPHHMAYEWYDGDPIVAGGLYNGTTFVFNVDDIPNVKLANTISMLESGWSVPDAYERLSDGRYVSSYMGGPVANFGGSPGALAILKPDSEKGLVLESITPAGQVLATANGNPGGVPEACSLAEGRPLGTCANPHGIQAREDLQRMVTYDFVEPRELVLDPVKPLNQNAFRPTIRTWDISDHAKPKLVATGHVPAGWRKPGPKGERNTGPGEGGKTWPAGTAPNMLKSDGVFSGLTCGGGVLFNPDISKDKGDSTNNWYQVWDDTISQMRSADLDSAGLDHALDRPASCPGGTWLQISHNNRTLFRVVEGRIQGGQKIELGKAAKIAYSVDIQPLLRSYAKYGRIQCDLTKGIDSDRNGTIDIPAKQAVKMLAEGKQVADCPRAIDELIVDDPTSGGPHWGAVDNHTARADGSPRRLVFSNYFVSRTGVDGDHRYYVLDIDRHGRLSYDPKFRDEVTGALGVDFNRRDWPGAPGAGYYKPHSMVWVCPPGICT